MYANKGRKFDPKQRQIICQISTGDLNFNVESDIQPK